MANIEELQKEIKYNNAMSALRRLYETEKSKVVLQCEYAIKFLRKSELDIAADALDCMLKKLAKEAKEDKKIIEDEALKNDGYTLRSMQDDL